MYLPAMSSRVTTCPCLLVRVTWERRCTIVGEEGVSSTSRERVTTRSTEREIRSFILLLDSGSPGCFALYSAGVVIVWEVRQSRQYRFPILSCTLNKMIEFSMQGETFRAADAQMLNTLVHPPGNFRFFVHVFP